MQDLYAKDGETRIAYTAEDAVELRFQGWRLDQADVDVPDEPPLYVQEPRGGVDLTPPPMGGAGSGVDAWTKYADAVDVDVDGLDKREDIVAAIEKAGQPVEPPAA